MQDVSADGFSNLCRLCGEVEECFDLFTKDAEGAEILDRIERSIRIAIKEGDGLPTGICNGCHEKLEACSTFYDQCHDTQERLREFISIESVLHKTEPPDSQDDEVLEGNEDNDYFYMELDGDQAASDYVEADEGTAVATGSAIEYVEIEQGQDLPDDQTFAVPAEEIVATDASSLPTTGRKKLIPLRDSSSEQKQDFKRGFQKEYRLIVEQLRNEKSTCNRSDLERCTQQPASSFSQLVGKTKLSVARRVVDSKHVEQNVLKPVHLQLPSKLHALVSRSKGTQNVMKLKDAVTHLSSEPPALVRISNEHPPPLAPFKNALVPYLVHFAKPNAQVNNCISQAGVFSMPSVKNAPSQTIRSAQTFVQNATAVCSLEKKTISLAKVQRKPDGPIKIVKSSMAVPEPSISLKSLKKGRAFIMSGDRSVAVEVAVFKPGEVKTIKDDDRGASKRRGLPSESQTLKPPVFKRKDSCVADPYLVLKNGTLVKLEEVEKNVPLEQIPVPPVIVLHSTTKGKPAPSFKLEGNVTFPEGCSYSDPPIELNSGLLVRSLPSDSVCKVLPPSTTPSESKHKYFVVQSHSCKPWKVKPGLISVRAVKRKNTVYVCPEAREQVEEVQSNPPLFKCKICWTTCSDRKRCEYHVMNMHLSEHCAFECAECGKKFATKSLLSNHKRVKHICTGYVCSVCGSVFRSLEVLQGHEVRHTTLEPPFKCTTCAKGFFAKNNLRRHEKDVHSDKVFICDVCGETFPTLGRLNEHKLTHVGDFSCNLCGKVCKTRNNLRVHKLGHKTINYMHCPCGKKFSSFAFYHNHKRICKYKLRSYRREGDVEEEETQEQVEIVEEVETGEQVETSGEVQDKEHAAAGEEELVLSENLE